MYVTKCYTSYQFHSLHSYIIGIHSLPVFLMALKSGVLIKIGIRGIHQLLQAICDIEFDPNRKYLQPLNHSLVIHDKLWEIPKGSDASLWALLTHPDTKVKVVEIGLVLKELGEGAL